MRHATRASASLALLALLAVQPPARAQSAATMRARCQGDYAAHCTGDDPAPGLERACLAQYYVNLSEACRTALDAARAKGNGQGG